MKEKERIIDAFLARKVRKSYSKISESDIEVNADGEEIIFTHEAIASIVFDDKCDFAIVKLMQPERSKATVKVHCMSAGREVKSEIQIDRNTPEVKFYLDDNFSILVTRRIPSGKEITMVVKSGDSGA